eukprot:1340620-Pyramimonas_sp.AAC.1
MSHMALDFFLMPISNFAFRKSPTAGQSYGGQVREKGAGRKMRPPGMRAGFAPMEGTQEMAPEWQREDKATAP